MKKPEIFDLESIKTEDGELVPIYRDWDPWHAGYIPQMAYITTLKPGVVKGPILHERRRGLMMAYSGEVEVECMIDGKISSFSLIDKNENRKILLIPAGVPNKITNLSLDAEAIIINLPDRAWRPDDEDTIKFESWESYQEYSLKEVQ